ncbi:MAG: hypothetical protein VX747_03810, partial [Actinomycetota bacterium]|nr:hypothetical protein [Actinomycetota bacterium]
MRSAMCSVACAVSARLFVCVCWKRLPAPAMRARYEIEFRWCVTASACEAAPDASPSTSGFPARKAACVVSNSSTAGLMSTTQLGKSSIGLGASVDEGGASEGDAGASLGEIDGDALGDTVGDCDGDCDGLALGDLDG